MNLFAKYFCQDKKRYYYYYYYYYLHYIYFFPDNLGKPVPERQTILDFTGARDDGVAVHQLDHMCIICTSLTSDK